jgi:hypothetical protein
MSAIRAARRQPGATGAVAHLNVPAQLRPGVACRPIGVQPGQLGIPVGVAAGDLGDHLRPVRGERRVADQLAEQICPDVDLHDAAPACRSARASARTAVDQPAEGEVALGVDDGESPLRAGLAVDEQPGVLGGNRPPARDLGRVVVEPEQRGQSDT